MGPDRPLKIAIQMDDQTPQTVAFIPASAPGTQPAAWGGNDGFVANNAVFVPTSWTIAPGAHTLKVSFKASLWNTLCILSHSYLAVDGGTRRCGTKDCDRYV